MRLTISILIVGLLTALNAEAADVYNQQAKKPKPNTGLRSKVTIEKMLDKEIMEAMGAEKIKEIMEAMKGDENIKALDSNKTIFGPKEISTGKKYMIEMKNETDFLIETIKMADDKDFDKKDLSSNHTKGSTRNGWKDCASKIEHGIDYPWSDINNGNHDRRGSMHACIQFCQQDQRCVGWVWNTDNHACWKKWRMANRRHAGSRISGTCQSGGGGAASFTVSSTGPAATHQGTRMGVYHSTGQTYYNFPVYKKTAGSVQFLFVDSFGYWSVSDELHPTDSGLYHPETDPTPSSPPVIGWKYTTGVEWYDDHQLTVRQTGGGGGGGGGCHVEHNIAYYHNTVTILWRRRQQACANSCARHRRCHFWTFKQIWNRCWIKTSNSGRGHGHGFVSGNKACGSNWG